MITSEELSVKEGFTPPTIQGSSPRGGNGKYEYKWQKRTSSTNWAGIPEENKSFFQPPKLQETTFYRRIISSGNAARSFSNTATVNVITFKIRRYRKLSLRKKFFDGQVEGITANFSYQWFFLKDDIWHRFKRGSNSAFLSLRKRDPKGPYRCRAQARINNSPSIFTIYSNMIYNPLNRSGKSFSGERIIEEKLSFNLKIYPNPTNGTIHFNMDMKDILGIDVISLDGKKVFSQYKLTKNSIYLPEDIKRGIYIINFNKNNGEIIRKKILLK